MQAIHRSIRAPLAASFTLWLMLGTGAQAQVPLVAPTGSIWPAGDGFVFKDKPKKTRRAVSGIACAPNALHQTICLMAFDEGVTMQFAELGDGRVQPTGQRLVLGGKGDELDAEGAATDGAFFYLTGSHAVKRKNCEANPASQHVLRFKRDGQTGLAASSSDLREAGQLLRLFAALPELAPYTGPGHCLGSGGIDIEGLAVRGGRLFFGLRGPTEAGAAFIVSVDANAFFDGAEGADAKAKVHRLKLGPGLGLRDMVAVRDGILLLAGPDDDKRHAGLPWRVLHWDEAAVPKPLAVLDLGGVKLRQCDEDIKPEAMTVLTETAQTYRLLVLSDGLCDGGAMVIDVPR